jgi:hypothetical protein
MSLQKTNSYSKIEEVFSPGQVTHLQEVARNLCHEALGQVSGEMAPVQQSPGLDRLLQKREFFQSFKYHLAKGVAETLGTNDRHVQAVYIFEPAPNAETGRYQPPALTIHLLVVVSKPSAALDAFIEALERGLSQYLKELSPALLAGRCSLMNVILVTEAAIEQRQGYASLISSILTSPFKVWERKA